MRKCKFCINSTKNYIERSMIHVPCFTCNKYKYRYSDNLNKCKFSRQLKWWLICERKLDANLNRVTGFLQTQLTKVTTWTSISSTIRQSSLYLSKYFLWEFSYMGYYYLLLYTKIPFWYVWVVQFLMLQPNPSSSQFY